MGAHPTWRTATPFGVSRFATDLLILSFPPSTQRSLFNKHVKWKPWTAQQRPRLCYFTPLESCQMNLTVSLSTSLNSRITLSFCENRTKNDLEASIKQRNLLAFSRSYCSCSVYFFPLFGRFDFNLWSFDYDLEWLWRSFLVSFFSYRSMT